MNFYKNVFLPAALAAGMAFSGCGRPGLISSETRNGIEKAEYDESIVFRDKRDPLLEVQYFDYKSRGNDLDGVEYVILPGTPYEKTTSFLIHPRYTGDEFVNLYEDSDAYKQIEQRFKQVQAAFNEPENKAASK